MEKRLKLFRSLFMNELNYSFGAFIGGGLKEVLDECLIEAGIADEDFIRQLQVKEDNEAEEELKQHGIK